MAIVNQGVAIFDDFNIVQDTPSNIHIDFVFQGIHGTQDTLVPEPVASLYFSTISTNFSWVTDLRANVTPDMLFVQTAQSIS